MDKLAERTKVGKAMRFVTSAAEEIVKIRKEKGGDPNVRVSLYVRTMVHINALTPVCSLGRMQMLHACVCIRTCVRHIIVGTSSISHCEQIPVLQSTLWLQRGEVLTSPDCSL